MGVLGGLDVGFGANMQIVRTNYLLVKDAGATTTAKAEKFLTLYNQHISEQARGNSGLLCDYIMPIVNACDDAGNSGVDSKVVIETINGSALPLANAHGSLSTGANKNGYGVIGVLGVGAVEFTDAALTAGAAIASAVDANADLANSNVLLSMVGATTTTPAANAGVATTVNVAGLVTDIVSALADTTDLTQAPLGTAFVEKGNSTGAAHTVFGSGTDKVTLGANSVAVLSITTLCGVGYI